MAPRPIEAALAKRRPDGIVELSSPLVGLWREPPEKGSLLRPGMRVGAVEVLGVLHDLVVPEGAAGIVVERAVQERARTPVGYGTVLVVLDPEHAGQIAEAEIAKAEETHAFGMVFAAPMGGRYYARPSPDRPSFVAPGDEIALGQTVCLLEVMKTFNRVTYDGDPVRIARIIPKDGDDLAAGDPILELEPLG